MTCSRCGGRMRLVEIADSRDDIARVLANVGLGPRPPPRPRPALPGQLELALAVWPARQLDPTCGREGLVRQTCEARWLRATFGDVRSSRPRSRPQLRPVRPALNEFDALCVR